MLTIGQVAEMFDLPISTLRYYDKQGLFPNMERVSGIRKFSEAEIEALRVIEYLKKAGMEINDIRQFMDWWHTISCNLASKSANISRIPFALPRRGKKHIYKKESGCQRSFPRTPALAFHRHSIIISA